MKIRNAFTGEEMNTEKKQPTQEELDSREMIEVGDRGWKRPKNVGRNYGAPHTAGQEPLDRVDQTAKDSTDINNIMKRYEQTGQLEELVQMGALGHADMQYGDFTDAPTFQEALNITIHAKDQFAKLDAHIRNRFQNNPANFLAFMGDPKNNDEIYRMGLAVKKQEKPPEVTLGTINETLKSTLGKKKPPATEE